MKVEIISDIACPWCYVAKTRFWRALREFPGAEQVEVDYLPFQLNPMMPTEPKPLFDYYIDRYGPEFRDDHASIADVAAREGLEFHMEQALAVNTLSAHRLVWLAGNEYGRPTQHAVDEALMRTYFTDGGNVADLETLIGLAAAAGMDTHRVRTALSGDNGTEQVQAAIKQAQERGIHAVPTMMFNERYTVQGAQEVGTYRKILEKVAAGDALTIIGDRAANCNEDTCKL
ncbi:DsbA family oxidoreductase [Paenibacillus sp. 5J-6]|uniref:DsbA family oxidoreductase n=1 Tax=Paenibacillus silvestris TaxID=2606219 RepID=A0A6L8V5C6_9BACL|nr:DsbA family oxidoreductase [Paenibacillus silvestris]MZQ84821.1 DsbA family oxidoreductase [Paenibacillus silvestris]